MKTLRYIGMALLAVILCVNTTACSDDNDENSSIPTLVDLVGSVWSGTDPEGYNVEVTIESATTISVAVSGNGYEGESTHTFTYDEETGIARFTYDGVDCVASISGNSMTVNMGEYKMNMKRIK